MTNLLASYSLFDITIVLIVIASILIIALIHFSESKKSVPAPIGIKEQETASNLLISPQITIIFQKDISDDEELSKEIADMYISNRAYYYAGKEPPVNQPNQLSEKYDDVFIKYDKVDFSTLYRIDI